MAGDRCSVAGNAGAQRRIGLVPVTGVSSRYWPVTRDQQRPPIAHATGPDRPTERPDGLDTAPTEGHLATGSPPLITPTAPLGCLVVNTALV